MGSPNPNALLAAKVDEARHLLFNHLLQASDVAEVALARAVYFVLDEEWTNSRGNVSKILGSNSLTLPTGIQRWHDHAVGRAKDILDWETTSKARREAYSRRRQSYEKLFDNLSKNLQLWRPVLKVLMRGAQPPVFQPTQTTPRYMKLLKNEFFVWFDRQRPTAAFLSREPADGLAHFLQQRTDLAVLLLTVHSPATPGFGGSQAAKAVDLQLSTSSALSRPFELYPAWDAKKVLAWGKLAEAERTTLAASVFSAAQGGLVKCKRYQYSSNRLAALFGSDVPQWDQATSSCLVLSDNRKLAQALETAMKVMESGKRPPAESLKQVESQIDSLLSERSKVTAISVEPLVDSLWNTLQTKYHLDKAPSVLDVFALNRILLMGIRQSAIQSQMLSELAESRVCSFLQTRKGRYSLGLQGAAEDRPSIFVPGHAVRVGDDPPETRNRQISDGVLGYWDAGTFVICAILEARVRGSGGRELWFDSKKKLEDLSRLEQAHLRAFANREWLELRETVERIGQVFSTTIPDIFQTEIGSQIARDLQRLLNAKELRINGILSPIKLLEGPKTPVKVMVLFAKATEQSNPEYASIQREVSELTSQFKDRSKSKTTFKFEPFSVPFRATTLDAIWMDIRDQANRMVYCPAVTKDTDSGCHPATSPADFLKYIRDLYARATAWKKKGADGANERVLEWLRHLDYNDDKWNQKFLIVPGLAGPPDIEWLESLKKDDTFASGQDFGTLKNHQPPDVNNVYKTKKMVDWVADPKHPQNLKVSHWAASTDGALQWFQESAARPPHTTIGISDVSGWAGDLITFYDDWQAAGGKDGPKYCRDRLCRTDDAGSFKLRDLIEDADAFNISTALRNDDSRTIVQELEELFRPVGGGYGDRLGRFFRGRFVTAANCAGTARNVLVTDHKVFAKGREVLIRHGSMPSAIPPAELDAFCNAFGQVLEDICAAN